MEALRISLRPPPPSPSNGDRDLRLNSSDALEEEEINIYLKIIKTIAVRVKRSETIKNLKSMFHEREGVSENLQELFFAGDRLKDGQKLVDYGIQKDSTLHLVLQDSVGMKIFVKIPSNEKTIVVEVKTHDTIQNIKSMIQAKEGIQSDRYTLIYAGKLLEDNRTLASLNIQSESILHLVFNPRDVLSIFVKTPAQEIVELEVKVLYTVDDVKQIIGSIIGFSVGDWNLTYAGKLLEDCKSLACYDINEESILEILPRLIQVFVKTWCGKTITLDVHQFDTVTAVMDKIFFKLGMPAYFQSLVFAGKRLEEGRDLASYNIQKDSTLHVVFSPSTVVIRMPLSEIEGSVLGSTMILDLKDMIQKKMHNPVKELYFHKKALRDEFSLADYGIVKDSTVAVVLEGR